MLPYWLLFGVFAAGSLGYKLLPRDRSGATPLFVAALFTVMLMIGLRFEVGGDWKNYLTIYRTVELTPSDQLLAVGDPAYTLVNTFAIWLGQGVWLVNLICAVVFTLGLYKFAQRQPNPWLAVMVAIPYLVIVVAMGYTRQAAAIGLIMIAFGNLEDRRYLRAGLVLVLAMAFHKSAFLVLPLIALAIPQHRLVIYTVSAVVGVLMFTVFLSRFVDTVITNYVKSEMSSQGAGVRIAMNIVPAVIYLVFQRKLVLNEFERRLWRNFALAAIGALVGLAVLPSTIVDRLALYLVPLQLFVLARAPYAFSSGGRPNSQVLAGVLVYSAAVQSIWLVFAANASYWLPYRMGLG